MLVYGLPRFFRKSLCLLIQVTLLLALLGAYQSGPPYLLLQYVALIQVKRYCHSQHGARKVAHNQIYAALQLQIFAQSLSRPRKSEYPYLDGVCLYASLTPAKVNLICLNSLSKDSCYRKDTKVYGKCLLHSIA